MADDEGQSAVQGWRECGPAIVMVGLLVAVVFVVALYGPAAEELTPVVAQADASSSHPIPDIIEELEEELTPEVRIEVNIPATELTVIVDGVELYSRRIAIGRGIYPTPEQQSFIKRIEWNPWWYPPPADWAKNDRPTPPGPRNPLGLVKLPLSDAILFHGTNQTWSVGRAASHGCMRMHNRDATAMAWYLQRHFSEKDDPKLREEYRKQPWRTFTVKLTKPVPVRLVYRPVVVKPDGRIVFYPDHYNRLWGRKKAAIISALIDSGMEIAGIDDTKVENLIKHWPSRGTAVSINDLMRKPTPPDILFAPECS